MNIQNTQQVNAGRYVVPTIEERTNLGVRTIDPYSKLYSDRVIFLATAVDAVSAMDITTQLLSLAAANEDEEITLYINSPGGSMSDMTMIIDTIQLIKPPVSTICLGSASSAAAVLLASGEKGSRFSLPNGRVMIHQPRIGGAGGMQASDIQIQSKEITRHRQWMIDFLSKRTGQTVEKINKDVERDLYMSAEEALEYGIIDGIIGMTEDTIVMK